MSSQVLKFPQRHRASPRDLEDAPHRRRPVLERLLMALLLSCILVNWALVTLGIVFIARGFR